MKRKRSQFIIDLELLNKYNSEGCPACGQKFNLGEPVVVACGAWEGGAKIIHENEAVYDSQNQQYVERRCFKARSAGSPI